VDLNKYDGMEDVIICYNYYFADGVEELIAHADSTMDDVRALQARMVVEATKAVQNLKC
jgi:hypothetical protein